jgi:hypothetical protein
MTRPRKWRDEVQLERLHRQLRNALIDGKGFSISITKRKAKQLLEVIEQAMHTEEGHHSG